MNMGAGRIVYQDLTRIDKSIRDGELFESPVLAAAMDRCVDGAARAALHRPALGRRRPQQPAASARARSRWPRAGAVPRVFVHAITDGRDTSPTGGVRYLAQLQARPRHDCRTGRVATICGRYYAMDRDKRWERTKLAYDAIVNGIAEQTTQSPIEALQALVRSRRHRRVHQADRRRRRRPAARSARSATATRSSSSTSARTAPASSRGRSRSTTSTASPVPIAAASTTPR